ncbi:hypothetical protein Pcinc_024396 [Petrolisthes cinctipes]|uniref:Uncharacterized protein n=1 Tax=Petrolisthes cinctipes TaxID=88211 RepID=A0AAE1FA08_PETCI|nr:hypothetical protein Pcinc_024396 [Petrolisthes cinctipes]
MGGTKQSATSASRNTRHGTGQSGGGRQDANISGGRTGQGESVSTGSTRRHSTSVTPECKWKHTRQRTSMMAGTRSAKQGESETAESTEQSTSETSGNTKQNTSESARITKRNTNVTAVGIQQDMDVMVESTKESMTTSRESARQTLYREKRRTGHSHSIRAQSRQRKRVKWATSDVEESGGALKVKIWNSGSVDKGTVTKNELGIGPEIVSGEGLEAVMLEEKPNRDARVITAQDKAGLLPAGGVEHSLDTSESVTSPTPHSTNTDSVLMEESTSPQILRKSNANDSIKKLPDEGTQTNIANEDEVSSPVLEYYQVGSRPPDEHTTIINTTQEIPASVVDNSQVNSRTLGESVSLSHEAPPSTVSNICQLTTEVSECAEVTQQQPVSSQKLRRKEVISCGNIPDIRLMINTTSQCQHQLLDFPCSQLLESSSSKAGNGTDVFCSETTTIHTSAKVTTDIATLDMRSQCTHIDSVKEIQTGPADEERDTMQSILGEELTRPVRSSFAITSVSTASGGDITSSGGMFTMTHTTKKKIVNGRSNESVDKGKEKYKEEREDEGVKRRKVGEGSDTPVDKGREKNKKDIKNTKTIESQSYPSLLLSPLPYRIKKEANDSQTSSTNTLMLESASVVAASSECSTQSPLSAWKLTETAQHVSTQQITEVTPNLFTEISSSLSTQHQDTEKTQQHREEITQAPYLPCQLYDTYSHPHLMSVLVNAGVATISSAGCQQLTPVLKDRLTVEMVMAALNLQIFKQSDVIEWICNICQSRSTRTKRRFTVQFQKYRELYQYITSGSQVKENWAKFLRTFRYRLPHGDGLKLIFGSGVNFSRSTPVKKSSCVLSDKLNYSLLHEFHLYHLMQQNQTVALTPIRLGKKSNASRQGLGMGDGGNYTREEMVESEGGSMEECENMKLGEEGMEKEEKKSGEEMEKWEKMVLGKERMEKCEKMEPGEVRMEKEEMIELSEERIKENEEDEKKMETGGKWVEVKTEFAQISITQQHPSHRQLLVPQERMPETSHSVGSVSSDIWDQDYKQAEAETVGDDVECQQAGDGDGMGIQKAGGSDGVECQQAETGGYSSVESHKAVVGYGSVENDRNTSNTITTLHNTIAANQEKITFLESQVKWKEKGINELMEVTKKMCSCESEVSLMTKDLKEAQKEKKKWQLMADQLSCRVQVLEKSSRFTQRLERDLALNTRKLQEEEKRRQQLLTERNEEVKRLEEKLSQYAEWLNERDTEMRRLENKLHQYAEDVTDKECIIGELQVKMAQLLHFNNTSSSPTPVTSSLHITPPGHHRDYQKECGCDSEEQQGKFKVDYTGGGRHVDITWRYPANTCFVPSEELVPQHNTTVVPFSPQVLLPTDTNTHGELCKGEKATVHGVKSSLRGETIGNSQDGPTGHTLGGLYFDSMDRQSFISDMLKKDSQDVSLTYWGRQETRQRGSIIFVGQEFCERSISMSLDCASSQNCEGPEYVTAEAGGTKKAVMGWPELDMPEGEMSTQGGKCESHVDDTVETGKEAVMEKPGIDAQERSLDRSGVRSGRAGLSVESVTRAKLQRTKISLSEYQARQMTAGSVNYPERLESQQKRKCSDDNAITMNIAEKRKCLMYEGDTTALKGKVPRNMDYHECSSSSSTRIQFEGMQSSVNDYSIGQMVIENGGDYGTIHKRMFQESCQYYTHNRSEANKSKIVWDASTTQEIITSLMQENRKLHNEKRDSDISLTTLENDRVRIGKLLDQHKSDLKQATTVREQLEAQLHQYNQTIMAHSVELEELKCALSEKQSEEEETRKEKDRLQDLVKKVESKCEGKNKALREVRKDKKKLMKELEFKMNIQKKELLQLKTNVDVAEQKSQGNIDFITDLKDKVAHLENDLSKMWEDKKESSETLRERDQALTVLEGEVGELQNMLAEKVTKLQEKDQHIAFLESGWKEQKAVCQQLRLNMEKLEETLARQTEMEKGHQSMIREKEKVVRSLKEALSTSEDSLRKVEMMAKEDNTSRDKQISNLKKEVEVMKEKWQDAEKRILDINHELSTQRFMVAEIEMEQQRAKETAETEWWTKQEELVNSLRDKQQQAQELQTELEQVNKTKLNLTIEIAEMQAARTLLREELRLRELPARAAFNLNQEVQMVRELYTCLDREKQNAVTSNRAFIQEKARNRHLNRQLAHPKQRHTSVVEQGAQTSLSLQEISSQLENTNQMQEALLKEQTLSQSLSQQLSKSLVHMEALTTGLRQELEETCTGLEHQLAIASWVTEAYQNKQARLDQLLTLTVDHLQPSILPQYQE